jgi:hypothetical protein
MSIASRRRSRAARLHTSALACVAFAVVGGCEPANAGADTAAIRTHDEPPGERTFAAACDGSAGVAVDSARVLIANDEDNLLRVYDLARGGAPTARFDLSPLLALPQAGKEVDLEGAAAIGDTVYWITSHAPNPEGKARPNRYRLFATRLDRGAAQPVAALVGAPYGGLLDAMAADPALAPLVAGRMRAPEQPGAVNIEGLSATPDGRLLIGFRNPIVEGRAPVVTLQNPSAVLDGSAAPRFAAPLYLDLGGRGVRSLEWSPGDSAYHVVAGPSGSGGEFALYRWRGGESRPEPVATPTAFAALGPEGLAVTRGGDALVLSDDGDRSVAGKPCKEAAEGARSFRAVVVPRARR